MARSANRLGRAAALGLLLALVPALGAADERALPASLSKEQKENLLKFLKENETPDRYVPKGARFPDAPPPVFRQDPSGEKHPPTEVGQGCDPAARDRPVALGEQQQAARLICRRQLLGRHRLVRDDTALDLGPDLEIGRRRGNAQLDHGGQPSTTSLAGSSR